jgi:DNA-binding transcriptional regulator YiaG
MSATFTISIREPALINALRSWYRGIRSRELAFSFENFLSQILEERAAEFRAQHLPHQNDELIVFGRPVTVKKAGGHERKLSPAQIQQILHLRTSENLSIVALAARFRVGTSTVQRILSNERRTQDLRLTRRDTNRAHGDPGKW